MSPLSQKPTGFTAAGARRVWDATKQVENSSAGARLMDALARGGAAIPVDDIPFRNGSGSNLPAYGVHKVSGVEALGDWPRLISSEYSAADYNAIVFINSGEAVESGGSGVVQQGRFQIVKYNSSVPAVGVSVGPVGGQTYMDDTGFGWRVCGELDSANDLMVVEKAGEQNVRIGKADADITVDGSGAVSIWNGSPLADSGTNITAHLDWMHGSEKVSSGKEVAIMYFADEDKWRIIGAECE